MDDSKFQALMVALMNRPSQGGEEDYRDFLVNFMNARNHGATDEDVNTMLDFIPDHISGMRDYALSEQTKPSGNTNIDLDRNELLGFLRGRK